MIKVKYFSPGGTSYNHAGSIRARYFYKELNQNFNVSLMTPFFPVPKNHYPLLFRLLGEAFLGLELSIRLFFTRCDLVVLSSPPYVSVLITGLFLSFFNRSFILDVRDLYPEVFFELGFFSPSSLPGRFLKSLTQYVCKKAKGIVATTKKMETTIKSYKVNENTATVFNGFDPNLFFPKNPKDKFEKFTLIFHGNLARMQNIDLLIKIARSCPEDVDVLVAGFGPGEKKIRREKRIKFLGRLSYEKIPEIVTKSHVGLSFRNKGLVNEMSFPVKIFEYIGAGLPVISTPKTDAGHFLEENELGYQFENEEVDAIINRIKLLKKEYHCTKPFYDFSRENQSRKFVQFIRKSMEIE